MAKRPLQNVDQPLLMDLKCWVAFILLDLQNLDHFLRERLLLVELDITGELVIVKWIPSHLLENPENSHPRLPAGAQRFNTPNATILLMRRLALARASTALHLTPLP